MQTGIMTFTMSHAWIIPLLALVGFLVNGLILRLKAPKLTGVFGLTMIGSAALFSYKLAYDYFSYFAHGAPKLPLVPFEVVWLPYLPELTAKMGTLLDPISVMMLIVVTTVSAMVHLYSIGYMKGDPGYGRFFTYLSFFTFNMLGLVLAPNIIQMFVFWELVGLTSFLLIGFYYQKPSAVSASKKAFIVTRFADLGFVIGILLLGYLGVTSGLILPEGVSPLDFAVINSTEFTQPIANSPSGFLDFSLLGLALFLIYCGAAGKSAMFPLHIWLPDAMEGPTPVSALIHAATMVVAGVYLTARLFPAFSMATETLELVAYIGTFTSIFAAIIACTQDDIKRVLAFSTLSQLGYLMMALGVATMENPLGFTASMFHLFTHAFFKALLFLGAGSVIHAVHSNSIWEMGGLRKKMPITHITFLIACLAIAGIPPFSGFFSKDEILAAAVHSQHSGIAFVAYAVAALTAFYMFRIYFLTFLGKARSTGAVNAHEAPLTMTIPLMILAGLSVVTGFIPMNDFVGIKALDHHGIDYSIAIPATLTGIFGIVLAYIMYLKNPALSGRAQKSIGRVYYVIKNKFYIDDVYLFITKNIIFNQISAGIGWIDRNIVDGAMNMFGVITHSSGRALSKLQSGMLQFYATIFVFAILVIFYLLTSEIL